MWKDKRGRLFSKNKEAEKEGEERKYELHILLCITPSFFPLPAPPRFPYFLSCIRLSFSFSAPSFPIDRNPAFLFYARLYHILPTSTERLSAHPLLLPSKKKKRKGVKKKLFCRDKQENEVSSTSKECLIEKCKRWRIFLTICENTKIWKSNINLWLP